MTRIKSKRDPEIVRNFLREGDPGADGRDPAPGEIAAWKRAMLREAEGRHWKILRPAWGAVVASAVLAAAGLIWVAGDKLKPAGDRSAVADSTPAEFLSINPEIGSAGTATDPAAPRHARTIRFRGPDGTRIIWQLDPDFSVPGT